MDPETQLTHPAMTFTCVVQEDVLRGCLGRFYSRAKGEEEGTELYSRTKEQARMLLLHLLVVALIADEYSLGARQFEALRAALKLTPQDLVTHFKCAVYLSRGSFGDLRAASFFLECFRRNQAFFRGFTSGSVLLAEV